MNGYTITGNLSNCHCRDIDPTEIAIGETVQWTLGGDVGYGKPAAADVSVTNATGSYDEATGVLTISNATGPVTVTASGSIVSLSQAFTIGDDISGGSTIYVNKVANIDNICASIIADTNVPSFTLNQVDYHTIACKDDFTAGTVTYPVLAVSYNTQNGSKSLVYKWGGIGNQQQQLWNSSSGWSNDIAADGSLTLGGSESGTIGLLYGDGWNGVVLGQKEQTTSGTLVGVQDFPVCSRDYFVINTYGVDMDDYCTNVLSYVTEVGYSNSHLIDGVDTTVYGGQTIKKLLWARYSGYMQYTIFAGNTPVWSSFSGTVQIDASTSVSVVAGWQNVDDGCYLRIPADDKIYIAQYGAGDQTLSTRNLVPNTWIEQFIEPIYAEDRVQTYTFKTKVSNDAIKGIMGAWPNWVSSQGYDYADFMRSNASGSTGEFIGLRLEKASGDPSQGYKYAIATSDYSAVIWASEAFSFGPLSAQAAGWQPAVVNAQYVASASTLYSPFSSPNGDWNGVFIGKAFVQDVIGGGGGSSGSGGVGGSND